MQIYLDILKVVYKETQNCICCTDCPLYFQHLRLFPGNNTTQVTIEFNSATIQKTKQKNHSQTSPSNDLI